MGLFGRDDRTDGRKPAPGDAAARQRSDQPTGSSVTLIARGTHVEGVVRGAGEVRIEGTVKGTIDCSSTVLVATGGQVEAELRAETISVAGRVRGDLVASQKVELTPTAEVEGDITSPRLLIREGANFEGQVFMTGRPKRPAGPRERGEDDDAAAEPAGPESPGGPSTPRS